MQEQGWGVVMSFHGTVGCIVAALLLTQAQISESADHFSRANCWNNESLSWSLIQQQWRGVFSHHWKNGVKQHYVTENPPAYPSCVLGVNGDHDIYGFQCLYYVTKEYRHAGVHGGFLSSDDPHPDGDLSLFTTTDWYVEGKHTTWIKPINKFLFTATSAIDCNGEIGQFCC
ncbi:MAG: hypothetical protein OEW73_14745 [Gammaproteobacteria bacterium]|nr:hypothetical protein [Gammaproteobacteria bacterium]MDH5262927.1 hypothetical protein [Gammaproteobacteria bacterium]